MMWDLPVSVEIDGKEYAIRQKCDYRVVLDVLSALGDVDLEYDLKVQCTLFIFYEDLEGCENVQAAAEEMMKIINYGEADNSTTEPIRKMDWEYDFKQIAPPISRVLGYEVRTPSKYTHWWTFLGGFFEIGGDCVFANIISIREKKMKGKKLETWEQDFYRENRNLIDLPQKLTSEEQAWLDSDW